MSVKSVWIDGFQETYDSSGNNINTTTDKNGNNIPRLSIEQGSAVESSPGLFLTAGHVVAGPLSVDNGSATTLYKSLPVTSTYRINATIKDSNTPNLRQIIGGNTISNINLLGYSQTRGLSSSPGADLTAFQSAPVGTGTGMIAFNHPTVAQISDFFPYLSYTGFPLVPITTNGTTPTPYYSGNQTLQSVNAYVNTGSNIRAGGPGTLQISGPAKPGTSGAGVIGNATNGNTYIIGTIEGQVGNNTTLVNYINAVKLWSILSNYTLPSGLQQNNLPRNELVGNPNGNDQIAGTNIAENIIANGGGNKILGGSHGDIINPGNGLNNEVFIPDESSGTTVLVTPGSTTIVGGTSQDRLAVLSDRLWNRQIGAPSSTSTSNSSSTIPLTGGLYDDKVSQGPIPSSAQLWSDLSAAGREGKTDPTNPVSSEIGDYDLAALYNYDGKDLHIQVFARNPTISYDPVIWRSNIDLVDYQAGEFGLSFKPLQDIKDWRVPGSDIAQYESDQSETLSMLAAPQSQSDLDDDGKNIWNYTAMPNIIPPSQSQLNGDLNSLKNINLVSTLSTTNISMLNQNSGSVNNLNTSDIELSPEASNTSAHANQLVSAMAAFDMSPGVDTNQHTNLPYTQPTLSVDSSALTQHKYAA